MLISRTGFGQVEPNHLSGQRTGQIYAQLPVVDGIDILENGQFVKYDMSAGKVNLTGKGESMLVFNEVKLYDERSQGYKDYAMQRDDFTNGEITPRLIKTNVGDIFTTNCIGSAAGYADAVVAGVELVAGDLLNIDAATGYLVKGNADAEMVFEVAKAYTMPDAQPGVKLVRVK